MDFQSRADLIHSVTNLHPSQLTILETVIGFPVALRPGAVAPSAERAAALVNWAESFGGPGLAAVARELARLLSEHMPPGAPSGAQNVGVNAPTGQVLIVQHLHGNVMAGGAETPPSAPPPPAGKLINVPQRNDFFTGREEILSALHEALTESGRAAIKQAISGLGGIGKTATATEYAHRHAKDYARILWTGAADAAALTEGFAILARELGLGEHQKSEETVAAVKRWLTTNPGWLLILDNADAPELVADFLPTQFEGKVLLTSRATNFDALGKCRPVTLEVMRAEEALAFLKERTGRPTLSESEEAAAKALAEELGYLPLALDQAGAYVAETPTTFAEYAELYAAEGARLRAERGAAGEKAHGSVTTTFGLAMRKAIEVNAGAEALMCGSAFLGADEIPEEALERFETERGKWFWRRRERCFKNRLALSEAVRAVTRYSLMTRNAEGRTLSVHRLVQAVVRDGMTESERREWIERGVKAVNAAFPDVEFENWSICARLAPHGVALGEAAARAGVESAELARLLNQTGYFLKQQGRYAETAPLYERSLAIYEKALGAEHPLTAQSLNNLAGLYRAQGEYGRALPLYERSLAIREKALGAEHPFTAASLNNLAELYRAQGEYGKALPLYERSLAICEKALGAEHPLTAGSLNNLAELYRAQGAYGKALPLYERSLAIYEKALGAEHPDTAASLNNLAYLYSAQGEYGRALPLYERALAIREKALGAEHPDTAQSLNNLAALYEAQGEYGRAEPLYERSLAILENALGAEHPLTAVSLNNLALLYSAQGEYGRAEPLFERSLAIREKALGAEHPDTKTVARNLARLRAEMAARPQ